jgi:hypothetical protein
MEQNADFPDMNGTNSFTDNSEPNDEPEFILPESGTTWSGEEVQGILPFVHF